MLGRWKRARERHEVNMALTRIIERLVPVVERRIELEIERERRAAPPASEGQDV